jgi:hypothetical protein
MASQNKTNIFVTSWRFVDPSDRESSKQGRLHAMRETARRQKWRKEMSRKNGLKAGSLARCGLNDVSEAMTLDEDEAGSDEYAESQCSASTKSTSSSLESERRLRLHRATRAKRKSPLAVTTTAPSPSLEAFGIILAPSPNPMSILGAGRTNPFDTYPVPNTDQRLDILTDICKSFHPPSLIYGPQSPTGALPNTTYRYQISTHSPPILIDRPDPNRLPRPRHRCRCKISSSPRRPPLPFSARPRPFPRTDGCSGDGSRRHAETPYRSRGLCA